MKDAPSIPSGHAALAILYERRHEWNMAIKTYKNGLKHVPNDPHLLKNMCTTLIRNLQGGNGKHVDELINVRDWCKKASNYNSDNPQMFSTLGDMHTLLMEWQESVQSYEKAILIAAGKGDSFDEYKEIRTLNNLANSLSRSGNVPKALATGKRALAINSHDAGTLALQKTVRSTGYVCMYICVRACVLYKNINKC